MPVIGFQNRSSPIHPIKVIGWQNQTEVLIGKTQKYYDNE